MENTIEINDLSFERQGRPIFRGVNFRIKRGSVTAIMGPSGCGKTTLLRLIGGQLCPSQGTLLVNGQNVPALSRHALFELRKKMGLLFQSGGLFTDLSVFDNVAFALREHTKLPTSLIQHLVLIKLQAVGLRGARDLMPHELSGGMSRRVALARSIALDPALMMYDEPLSGQDPISMGVLVRLIRSLNTALGMTSIIVSHDVKETLSIADYVYVISEGRVLAEGTPDQLRQNTSAELQQFLQGLADGPVPFHYPAKYSFEEELTGEMIPS